MTRIAYVDGRYRPIGAPAVRVEDRGLQFADGVYEVIKCLDGRLCDLERHLNRLERSLAALAIPMPVSRRALAADHRSDAAAQRLRDALVYLQVDRGVAPRNHLFPGDVTPDADRHGPPRPPAQAQGTGGGCRRCHPAGPALEALRRQVGQPAGQRPGAPAGGECGVPRGMALRCGRLRHRGRGLECLSGRRRRPACDARPRAPRSWAASRARWCWSWRGRMGFRWSERPFTVAEAYGAREAFLTSTSSLVLPVTAIDGRTVANGMPGSVTRRLLERYRDHLLKAG